MANPKGPRIRKTETSSQMAKSSNQKKPRSKKVRKINSPLARIVRRPKAPDNRVVRFLAKIGRVIFPGFIRGAFSEVRQTTWPDRKETLRLTWAVFVFAIVFSIIIAGLDFVLDKIFRSIILG